VSRDSAETKCNQTIWGLHGADYVLEILGQKWRALRNHLALRNRQNLVLGKNNQVSLTIGQILGTAAENTGWLYGSPPVIRYIPTILTYNGPIFLAKQTVAMEIRLLE
jgi:hypothetical protein